MIAPSPMDCVVSPCKRGGPVLLVLALTLIGMAASAGFAAGQALPAAPPQAGGTVDYVLGVEDEIEISVYGDSDLEKTQAVRPGGLITFPLIGSIQASGRTPEQLRQVIAEQLAPYVNNPKVSVIVRGYNSRKVSVLGQVKAPGLLRVSSDITVLEALSRAGGVSEEADLRGALVLRGQQLISVDFMRLLKQGDPSQNVPLQPGDVILIPSVNEKKVFVLGQVASPLVVPLTPDLNLVEAISRAGGVTANADLVGALVVRNGKALPVNFDSLLRGGDLSQNIRLEADDTILVPNINDTKIYVLGSVRTPLAAPLKPGTTLVDAVSMAGGFLREARTSNVLLVRGGLGDPQLIKVDFDDIVHGNVSAGTTLLQRGDIVYVPRTIISNVASFFQDITSILTPFVIAESGVAIALDGFGVLQQNIVPPVR